MLKTEHRDEIVGNLPVNGSSHHLEVLFQYHDSIQITVQHWVDLSLKIGMPVTEKLLSQLKSASEESEATEIAFRFLRLRPRTEHEVDSHLERKGYDDSVRSAVLAELRQRHLVNDSDYVRLFAEQKASHLSKMEISWKLRQRGIDTGVIDSVLAQLISPDIEFAAAVRLGQKQWGKHRTAPEDSRRVKVAQYLQRKGFAMETVYAVLHELENTGIEG